MLSMLYYKASNLFYTTHNQSTCALCLGVYSPSILLEAFLRQVGSALSTVTNLIFLLEDTGGSTFTAAVLNKTLELLVSAFPVLKCATIQGYISQSVLCRLGEACPLLTDLILLYNPRETLDAQRLVDLLPSLLPQVSSLDFSQHCQGTCMLPNMMGNDSLVSLDIPNYTLSSQSDWYSLPPNLKLLFVGNIVALPTFFTIHNSILNNLLMLHIGGNTCANNVAQSVRNAPRLEYVSVTGNLECNPTVIKASSLRFLHDRMEKGLVINARFTVDAKMHAVPHLCLTLLPSMTHVTRCHIVYEEPGDLAKLLAVFPNMQQLFLVSGRDMDDHVLQDLAACSHLNKLDVVKCKNVTPMGVLALCLSLPGLCNISFHDCGRMSSPGLEKCKSLLKDHGVMVDMQAL